MRLLTMFGFSPLNSKYDTVNVNFVGKKASQTEGKTEGQWQRNRNEGQKTT